jgi:lipopolysaccharide/colanic/teichoic acid biosynthesis glycosyltransferase
MPMMRCLYRSFGKRALDLAIGIPAILACAPLLAVVAIIVRLDSPGPILFKQERLGRYGKTFVVYKFRTMTDRPRSNTYEIFGHDAEVTRVGYWLRRFKMDELPQLFNVIKGDMSLVGPRPPLPAQLADYDVRVRRRLTVRPGLTGLAQVYGGIHLPWPQRWEYDVYYADHLSFGLDLWILWRTLAVILLGEDRFVRPPPRCA